MKWEKEASRKMCVTPQMAQMWLNENNIRNRPLYDATIEAYARDMKNGVWLYHHQGIGFSKKGILLDGQQRLAAIVKSGLTVPLLVTTGLDDEVKIDSKIHRPQEAIDGGKSRSVGDRLKLAYGVDNSNLKSAIASVLINICTGQSVRMSAGLSMKIFGVYDTELEAVIENRSCVRGLAYAPVFGTFVFAAKCFMDKVIEFEKRYFSGEDLSSGNPILTLRRYMLGRLRGSGVPSYRRTVQNNCLTCLMYYVKGQPLNRIISSIKGRNFFEYKQQEAVEEIKEFMRL